MKKAAGIYAVFMGVSMIGMWIMFCITGSIPEIVTKPVEIGLHVLAEFITAIFLIIGGTAVLISKEGSERIYLFSMGMLLYTLIMSPGYFLQKGELPFVGMFVVFLIMAVLFICVIVNPKRQ